MVGDQAPSVAWGLCFNKDVTEPLEILVVIVVVAKYRAAVYTSNDNVMQCTRGVP